MFFNTGERNLSNGHLVLFFSCSALQARRLHLARIGFLMLLNSKTLTMREVICSSNRVTVSFSLWVANFSHCGCSFGMDDSPLMCIPTLQHSQVPYRFTTAPSNLLFRPLRFDPGIGLPLGFLSPWCFRRLR